MLEADPFAAQDGREYVLQDLHRMNSLACKRWPGVPVYFAGAWSGQLFCPPGCCHLPGDDFRPGAQSGLRQALNPLAGVGLALTSLLARLKGPQYRSSILCRSWLLAHTPGRVDSPATPYDWISAATPILFRTVCKRCKVCVCVHSKRFSRADASSGAGRECKRVCGKSFRRGPPHCSVLWRYGPGGQLWQGCGEGVDDAMPGGGRIQDVTSESCTAADGTRLSTRRTAREVYEDILTWCNGHV